MWLIVENFVAQLYDYERRRTNAGRADQRETTTANGNPKPNHMYDESQLKKNRKKLTVL